MPIGNNRLIQATLNEVNFSLSNRRFFLFCFPPPPDIPPLGAVSVGLFIVEASDVAAALLLVPLGISMLVLSISC